jgi:hypothetical protein
VWINSYNHERTYQGKNVLRPDADGEVRGRQKKLSGKIAAL